MSREQDRHECHEHQIGIRIVYTVSQNLQILPGEIEDISEINVSLSSGGMLSHWLFTIIS